jgi:hypothetical protein
MSDKPKKKKMTKDGMIEDIMQMQDSIKRIRYTALKEIFNPDLDTPEGQRRAIDAGKIYMLTYGFQPDKMLKVEIEL